MTPIVKNLVRSVALHSTNMEHKPQELPEPLRELSGHGLDTRTMADAIIAIQSIDDLSILAYMQFCVMDLLRWTYYHWNGILIVSANNKNIFEDQMGPVDRTLPSGFPILCAQRTVAKTKNMLEMSLLQL